MTDIVPTSTSGPSSVDTVVLCDLILEVAGRGASRMATTRNHMRVLEAAYSAMNAAQRVVAQERMRAAETKWGRLLYADANDAENDGIPPEMRVGLWLSRRKFPVRLLLILHRAAIAFADGMTSMARVMDYAYAKEIDCVIRPVGQTGFTEWMTELRIAYRIEKGIYAPGALCDWWVTEMVPINRKGTPYRACLEAADEVRYKRYRTCR
jgi:hypothetical protein